MKIHGYCTDCKKIKRVSVSGSQLARIGKGVLLGICSDCQTKKETAA